MVYSVGLNAYVDSVLTFQAAVDDYMDVYIANSPDGSGAIRIFSGGSWGSYSTVKYTLSGNVSAYYLLVYADDRGGAPHGFMPGNISLSNNQFYFQYSGTTSIGNNANHWRASASGWNNYGTPTSGLGGGGWISFALWSPNRSSYAAYFISPILRK